MSRMQESLIHHEEWNAVASKFDFLCMLYAYYYHRGWQTIVGKEIEQFIRSLCLWCTSIVATVVIDWNLVMHCRAHECASIYVTTTKASSIMIIVFVTIALLVQVKQECVTMRCALEMRRVYRFMGVVDEELALITWSDICAKFVTLNQEKKYILGECCEQSISLVVVMHNDHVQKYAHLLPGVVVSEYVERIWHTTSTMLIGRTISDARLVMYTRRVAVILILLSPLVIIVVFGNIMMLHAHDIRRGVPSLVSHDFTVAARWNHRAPGELPHILHERFENARPHAEVYMQYFTPAVWKSCMYALHFVFATSLAVLLFISALNDDILLEFHVLRVPVVTWIAVLSTLLLTRGNHQTHRKGDAEMREAFRALVMQINPPSSWSVVGISSAREVQSIFKSQWRNHINEVISCLVFPFWLLLQSDWQLVRLMCIEERNETRFESTQVIETPTMPLEDSMRIDDTIDDTMVDAYMSTQDHGLITSQELGRSYRAIDEQNSQSMDGHASIRMIPRPGKFGEVEKALTGSTCFAVDDRGG